VALQKKIKEHWSIVLAKESNAKQAKQRKASQSVLSVTSSLPGTVTVTGTGTGTGHF